MNNNLEFVCDLQVFRRAHILVPPSLAECHQ